MKIIHRWLAPLLGAAMLLLLASCATTLPTDSTIGKMSVEEARKVLPTRLKLKTSHICYGTSVWDCPETINITDVHVTSSRLIITNDKGNKTFLYWEELPDIKSNSTVGFGYIVLSTRPNVAIMTKGTDNAVVDALYVLKKNALKQKKEADEFDANFAASLVAYRNKATSNDAFPEEANKYKVQAEGAVRDKEFFDAADLYAEALKIAPWWSAGHFNRALVLGETGEYGEAKREMNYYLQLMPDAPNARAAQDKIYEWERLESK